MQGGDKGAFFTSRRLYTFIDRGVTKAIVDAARMVDKTLANYISPRTNN